MTSPQDTPAERAADRVMRDTAINPAGVDPRLSLLAGELWAADDGDRAPLDAYTDQAPSVLAQLDKDDPLRRAISRASEDLVDRIVGPRMVLDQELRTYVRFTLLSTANLFGLFEQTGAPSFPMPKGTAGG